MDNVNHPAHYQCGGVETIDVIRAKLGEGFGYYCEGNAIKYLTRWRSKGGVEDLRKAQVYLGWLVDFENPDKAPDKPKWVCIDESKPVAAFDVTDGTLTPLPPATAALIERGETGEDVIDAINFDKPAGEANG